jgi:hypothetical protein
MSDPEHARLMLQLAQTVGSFRLLQNLTPFGVQFRYEAFASFDEALDRDETIRQVSNLLAHVETLLAGT